MLKMTSQVFSVFKLTHSTHPFVLFSSPRFGFLYFKKYRLNLLSGKREYYSLDSLKEKWKQFKISDYFEQPYVLHLYYELSYWVEDQLELLPDDEPLAIEIFYQGESRFSSLVELANRFLGLREIPNPKFNFSVYEKQFDKCQENLKKGNCYQLNLTQKFKYAWDNNLTPFEIVQSFIQKKENLGPYFHATFIPCLSKLLVSNSPESLFQIHERRGEWSISTRPIKGSFALKNESKDSLKSAWKYLLQSPKEEAELYMISDLLRNDLCRIDQPLAKIVHKKLPLKVPGILHQYSHIEGPLSPQINLKQVIFSMFPGGSITGAPKKRVLKLLKEIELGPRGLYCGSTILIHKNLKMGSINIRTGDFDLSKRELSVGAGGGITLLSKAQEEYLELMSKLRSFEGLLKENRLKVSFKKSPNED